MNIVVVFIEGITIRIVRLIPINPLIADLVYNLSVKTVKKGASWGIYLVTDKIKSAVKTEKIKGVAFVWVDFITSLHRDN